MFALFLMVEKSFQVLTIEYGANYELYMAFSINFIILLFTTLLQMSFVQSSFYYVLNAQINKTEDQKSGKLDISSTNLCTICNTSEY
jgi:hypothetical protein